MKRCLVLGLLTMATLSMNARVSAVQAPRSANERIRIEHDPGATILVRDAVGDYGQHPRLLTDLKRAQEKSFKAVGAPFGIYPVDPDTVDRPSDLKWRLATRVAPLDNQRRLAPVSRPFRLEALPASDLAVIDSSVRDAAADGLALSVWVLEHGYVQMAPTRMEYAQVNGDPMSVPTRILIPVRKRGSRVPPQ